MNNIPEDILYEKYIIQHKPMHVIATELGVAVGSVYNYLKKYNIPSRKIRDYETTEKQRAVWRKLGASKKGSHLSDTTKKKISVAKKGKYRCQTKYGGFSKKRKDGYIAIFLPTHPHCTADGMVMEHRLVMEEKIGRYLTENEVVHHINHNRSDNRLENLRLMTKEEHARFHMLERIHKKEGMTY